MMPFLSHSKWLFIALIVVIVIIVVLIVLAIVLVVQGQRSSKKAQGEAEPEDGKKESWTERKRTPGLAGNFREAMSRLRDRLSTWKSRYDVPWYVLVGESGSGKTTIADTLHGASGETVHGDTSVDGAEYAPQWLLLDQAVLIDIPGAAFLEAPTAAAVPFGRHTAHSDREAWRNILRLCAKYRPREPLNGVILTISSEELLGAVQEPERPERVARIMEMARRLDDIQHFTGLKLPVYVLVTKCDSIVGFQSYSSIFCNRAHAASMSGDEDGIDANLFGWSNPYLLDTSYSPSWVDDAFDATSDVLLRYQLEMLAGSRSVPEANDVMMFPFALGDLREPLRAVLDRIFRLTAYHGPHILRGIYFCGREGSSDESSTMRLAGSAFSAPITLLTPTAERVIYLRHLFAFKIFAERFLANPVARGYFTRNGSVIAAQVMACILTIVLSAGTFAAWVRLSAAVNHHVRPTLQMLATELDQIAVAPGTNMAPAVSVLSSVGGSRVSELYSIAMPYSFVDLQGLHRRLHQVIQDSFDIVVLNSCHDALENRIYALLSEKPPTVTGAYAMSSYVPGTAWSIDPAYVDLDQYLGSIQTLETNIERYRFISTAGSGSIAQLNHLLSYLGASMLPDTSRFTRNPSYLHLLLNSFWSPLVLPSHFNQELAARVNDRVENFYASWFGVQNSPLAREVGWLRGPAGLPLLFSVQSEPTNHQLHAIVNHIGSMNSQLDSGTYDWLAASFQRENYPALGSEMDQMPFADSQFKSLIAVNGSNDLANLQGAVLSGTPQVLSVSNGQVRLADDVSTLGSVLGALLNYEVMNDVSNSAIASGACQVIPSGYVWNQGDLQTAVALYQMQEKINAELIPEVPGTYRQAVARLVAKRTAANIALTLANATTPNVNAVDAQSGFTTGLQNFVQSLGLLKQVENDLSALHDTQAQACLQRSMTRQANTLLTGINSTLPSMFLPSVRVVKGNLSTPVSLALYGFASPEDLQQYLATEQQKVETDAAEAVPLVNMLEADGGHSALLDRWKNISNDVAALNAKQGGGPIQTLELYITNDLDKVTPDRGCKTAGQGNTNDVFLNVRAQLANMAVNECHSIAVQRFNAIAIAFNRTIGGQFPFSQTLDNQPAAEASPQDVTKFYRTFDLYRNGLQAVLPSLVENPEAVTSFLQAIQQARPLVIGPGKLLTPTLSVDLRFRTDRSHEIYGNHIARWSVKIGHKSISYPPEPPMGTALTWQLGDPVSVSLRYAFDSPQVPSGANISSAARTNGNNVTYQYNDPWALYAMLRDHAAGSNDGANEYAFIIPNKNKLGTSANTKPPDTIVYLNVQLLPAGAKPGSAVLPFPVFPYQAPYAELKTANGD